ncbi:MAG TPA: hypothetical protein VK539_03155 [Myxococcaceae bacterium]|nr:hypothetical protein [Myxococcaceae bacterium]
MPGCRYITSAWLTLEAMAGQAGMTLDELRALCVGEKVKSKLIGASWRIWAGCSGLPCAADFVAMDWGGLKLVADQVGMHPETLRDLCRTGRVKARKSGGVWLVWCDQDGYTEELQQTESSSPETASE